jgi:hypothetical protein
MRKDEEVIELFYLGIHYLEKMFKFKAIVTKNGPWITVEFGTLVTVKGRGYANTLGKLDDYLDELAFGK